MERQLAVNEWSVIKSQPTERKQWELFYRFWCLKESYVKAIGVGITVSLRDIVFKLDEKVPNTQKFITGTKVFVKGVEQFDWVFEEILIDDDHCAAVAVNVSPENYSNLSSVDRFQFLNVEELTSQLESLSDPDLDYGRSFSAKPDKP
ncbi:hypothetical protein LSTR_LSTR015888 [Laodelphax striatellus]|uniref:L-aminoadipate-semialdehyde dehydrogenase-phosphopantetheinyl transferase n=1 Tax=Laodelphax striatellus TaxID=195883 RepID=A0A482XEF2_LAOST|nr:hypothetical protein LSTR_LSTR015888 [Laodelphax striatellus]